MHNWDPREVALRHPRLALAIFLALWVVFAYGNVIVRKGAILEDALVNPADPYLRMHEYVHERLADGFQGQGETIPFLLYFPDGIRRSEDLARISEFTERVRAKLGPSVLSLSVAPRYSDADGVVTSAPYIPDSVPSTFDIVSWKGRIHRDPSVFGILVGREFEWAAVVLFLPGDRDEVAAFRRIAEFVEQRQIPWWEWLYKTDIVTPPELGVGSHLVLHGIMDQGLNVDIFTLVTVGIVMTLPVFVLSFGALRPALLAVVVVVLSGMLWTRGAVGVAQLFDLPLKERVYLLLAYANCIVQGVSFALHKYECLHEITDAPDRRTRWRRARDVDRIVAFTALIAIAGFATLYSFQVWAIRELGIVSALGVVFVFVNACVFLPAIDVLFGGGLQKREQLYGLGSKPVALLESVALWLTPARCFFGLAVLCLVAGLLIWPAGQLAVWTRPLAFARDTAVERTATYLNAPGRIGFDALELLVEREDGGTIRDPRFLQQASELMERVRALGPTREIASILATVRRVSEESFGHPLPQTAAETSAAFTLIDSGLPRNVSTKLYYPHGVRMSVYHALERSDEVGGFQDKVLALARRDFPGLRVSAYGEMSLFPQWDHYIRIGKPINVFSSQCLVIVLCFLKISWSNRRRKRSGVVLRPLVGGIIASAPFLFAISVMALVMMSLGIALDAATAAITALAINASIDFGVYLLDEYQTGLSQTGSARAAVVYAIQRKGRVILADTLLNTLCFLPLSLSRFQPVAEMGWIMAVMLTACAFGTLVVMAALLPIGVREVEDVAPPAVNETPYAA